MTGINRRRLKKFCEKFGVKMVPAKECPRGSIYLIGTQSQLEKMGFKCIPLKHHYRITGIKP